MAVRHPQGRSGTRHVKEVCRRGLRIPQDGLSRVPHGRETARLRLHEIPETVSEGDLPMKTNKLLVATVLATAIGAPIAGFVGAMNVTQPTASTGVRVPFLHGFPTGQIAGQSELASLERANDWLNSPSLTA